MAREKKHCQKQGFPILNPVLQELLAALQLSPETLGHSRPTLWASVSIRTQQAHPEGKPVIYSHLCFLTLSQLSF